MDNKTDFSLLCLAFLIGIIIFSAIGSAEVYPSNKDVQLKFLCTLNNEIPSISALYNFTISYSNGTTFVSDEATPLGYGSFSYDTNFPEEGIYSVQSFCWDGAYSYSHTESIEVTYNGKEKPDGIVIITFSIGFLIVIGFLSYLFIYNLGHLAQFDYDLGDLIKNVSAYFVLLGLYLLSAFYMGNQMIDSIMVWIIGITGFTNVGMSFLSFIICFLIKRKASIENAW